MYRSENGVSTRVPPTAEELAALKAKVSTLPADAPDAMLASLLNLPQRRDNPRPRYVLLPSIPANKVASVALRLFNNGTAWAGADPAKGAGLNALMIIVNTVLSLRNEDGSVSLLGNVLVDAARAKAIEIGFGTEESIASVLSVEDDTWTEKIDGDSWAYERLGGAWIEPADVTAAKAS